jgi:hypothetical protein
MLKTQFQIIEAGLSKGPASPTMSAQDAAFAVIAADLAAGRIHATENVIIQIPSPLVIPYSFVLHVVLSRSERPQHPASCPLCLPAIKTAGQSYVALELPEWRLLALANPYPYLPDCITWAIYDHLPQHCGEARPGSTWHRVLRTMLRLCTEIPGHVIGFNEVAGNSLDHLHLVSHRPPGGHAPYAAQQIAEHLGAQSGAIHIGPEDGYPTDLWRLSSPNLEVLARAALDSIAGWQALGGSTASVNCAAIVEHNLPTLYVFPRSLLLTPWGWLAKPAILEMLGVFIASAPTPIGRVRRGLWGHDHFFQVLSSLRPWSAARVGSSIALACGIVG